MNDYQANRDKFIQDAEEKAIDRTATEAIVRTRVDDASTLFAFAESEDFIFPLHIQEIETTNQLKVNTTLLAALLATEDNSDEKGVTDQITLYTKKLQEPTKIHNRLRWVDYSTEESLRQEGGLKQQIQQHQKVLLVIHGILGDTDELKDFARPFATSTDAAGFDLVLTYDYETLNTPIMETAFQLEQQLEVNGITAASGHRLTVIAHSMGGLVSRWWIEKLGGATIVDKLIMAGTPNAGSRLAEWMLYPSYIASLLCIALNFGSSQSIILNLKRLLSNRFSLHENVATLTNKPFGNVIQQLTAQSVTVTTEYYVLAGNARSFFSLDENRLKFWQKLKVWLPQFLVGDTIAARQNQQLEFVQKRVFSEEHSDAVVDLASIRAICTVKTDTTIANVACHHWNYFSVAESVAAIEQFLQD